MAEKKRVAFYTLGCKLNFSESSQISRQFPADSFEIVDYKEQADIYVINTCAVTGKAEKKSRAAIVKFKKRYPDSIVAVVGCYSELSPGEIHAIKGADIVLGNSEKFSLPLIINNENYSISESQHNSLNEQFIPSYSSGDRTRSFFKIQDGCDYFCSYCTVPLARGRSRSDTIDSTLGIAKEIAASGVKEMILTGVNVGDFGRKNNEQFIDLLKRLDDIEGIERIRISSIEPNLLTDDIIAFVATSKKFLPHFHIPLQSASDKVLKAMKRRYSVSLFNERITKVKQLIPDCCIAIDLIVGFPGETDSDFEECYQYLANSPVSYMHVFTYSERERTHAVTMTDIVPNIERTKRSQRMLALSEKKKQVFYKENEGKERTVLFESDNEKGMMFGFTDNYIKVKTPFDDKLINQVRKVKLKRIDNDGVFTALLI
jgi:threonylcarbamoyladenosine tRNA methylthiotransferase MtaB